MDLKRTAQLTAGLIALMALGGHIIEFIVKRPDNPSTLATLWSMARYFTILTNALIMILYGAMALRGRAARDGWLAGSSLWIGIVAVVFWGLINDWSEHRSGLDLIANTLYHTVVPIAAILWWLSYAGKSTLRFAHALVWLIWPLGYSVYALGRGLIDGKYPYFFLDLDALGWAGVAKWFCILAVGFYGAGLLMIALSKALGRKRAPDSTALNT